MNFIDATASVEGGIAYLEFGEYRIKLTEAKSTAIIEGGYDGREVILGIRPEDLHDEPVFLSNSKESVVEVEVEVSEMLGAEVLLYVLCEGNNMTARVDPRTTAKVGDRIKLAMDINRIHVIDKISEQIICN
jgi:multiple sugar transport system ATP-binding protein